MERVRRPGPFGCNRRARVPAAIVPLVAAPVLLGVGLATGIPWLVVAAPVVPLVRDLTRRLASRRAITGTSTEQLAEPIRGHVEAARERALAVAMLAHDEGIFADRLVDESAALVGDLERMAGRAQPVYVKVATAPAESDAFLASRLDDFFVCMRNAVDSLEAVHDHLLSMDDQDAGQEAALHDRIAADRRGAARITEALDVALAGSSAAPASV